MARPATGSIRERELAVDATGTKQTAFYARFSLPAREYPDPPRKRIELLLGTTPDWSRSRADADLGRILAAVSAGTWVDPKTIARPVPVEVNDPSFHVVASLWWERKARDGISTRTRDDYFEWRLRLHLLPEWGDWPVSEINATAIDAWAGKLRDGDPSRAKPGLAASSINKLLDTLAAVLELARDRHFGGTHLIPNPANRQRKLGLGSQAQSRRERTGAWLDFDQLALLLRAADEVEAADTRNKLGRQELLMTLFLAGLRVSELCALTWGDADLRLGVLHIRDSKTASGIRPVPMPSALIEALNAWRKRTSQGTRTADWIFPTARGGQRDRNNVRQRILDPVLSRARVLAEAEDLPWPDKLTTHAGRRSCITFLIAAGIDIGRVQDFAGHEDARLTLGVYRQRQYLCSDERYRELMSGPQLALSGPRIAAR